MQSGENYFTLALMRNLLRCLNRSVFSSVVSFAKGREGRSNR